MSHEDELQRLQHIHAGDRVRLVRVFGWQPRSVARELPGRIATVERRTPKRLYLSTRSYVDIGSGTLRPRYLDYQTHAFPVVPS